MVFKLWVENGVLTPKHLETIEGRLSEVNASTDIGRIPTHISGNYGVFSAAEWKNWTVSFSLYALCGLLPQDDYRCWEKFVLVCRILCKPYITKDDLVSADALLLNFCKSFERLYCPDKVTCNMHLHCHLKDCLLDFGPIHVFWCFSFERYNGAFGKFHTNNKGIEIQFMRKIMTSKFCETLKETLSSSSFFDTLGCLFDDERGMVKLSHTMTDVVKIIKLAFPGSLDYSGISGTHVSLPKAYKISMLDREDLVFLLASYRMMYPSVTLNISHFGEIIRKYPYISILGEKFGSKSDCRKLRSACVLACKVNDHDSCSYDLRPCRVDFYFSHTACIGEKDVTNVFAKVTWFREYQDRYKYGNALQIWFCNKYEESGSSCFMPVERIRSRFSRGITGASKDLMCICPVTRRIISDN
ncbi:hypothetical protein FSP39_022559 [Pinctada imbricata]|uniref:Uncharacterized protein n=1 Tax=Pinctada imbricata TaxID=66713 RepID=A0AA89C758_PINIB|nr:hypothetical protein FSP39_022559 [Pinctada imbricata]